MKTMLNIFFDIMGIVQTESILQGQTVNQTYYTEILKRLRDTEHRKRPELWPTDWILCHDNAAVHKQCLAQKSITEMELPPHSSNFDQNDFLLFPKIRFVCLKGKKISGY
jgi:hypothetical protein